jgi:hypothetical protein
VDMGALHIQMAKQRSQTVRMASRPVMAVASPVVCG